jgi:hypothetical protein
MRIMRGSNNTLYVLILARAPPPGWVQPLPAGF